MAETTSEGTFTARWALQGGRPETAGRSWTAGARPVRVSTRDTEETITGKMRQAIETALDGRARWFASIGAAAEAGRLRDITARSRGPGPRKSRYPGELLDKAAAEYKRALAVGEYPVKAVERLLAPRGYEPRRVRRILTRCRETGRI
jgi:hypothetical protein